MPPLVSVVVRVGPRNRKYLDEALKSIERQTFRDYELVIDDKPGFVRALNESCQKARGKYTAVQDSDDISFPTRLEREVEYLERHPDVSVVGTWGRRIGRKSGISNPPTNVTIAHLFLWSRVLHTSTMMRKDDVMPFGPYRNLEEEDWDLWIRLVKAGKKVHNIPVPLVAFRFHGENRTKFLRRGLLLAAHIRERLLCLSLLAT